MLKVYGRIRKEELREKRGKIRKVFKVLMFLCAIVLLPFLSSVTMYGQGYQTFREEMDQIAKQTKLKIGPFRIYPAFRLRNIGYDDNVYYQREEEGPISDYTGTVSTEVEIYLLFRNYLIFSLTETPEYVYYFRETRERRWNNTFSPGFKLLFLNRFIISGRYSYINRRRRATSEFDVRANVHQRRFTSSLFYETARKTSFGIAASLEKISYEEITLSEEDIRLSRALNREERSGYFEFYYRIFSESFFFLNGMYTEYYFEHVESQWRNSYSYNVNSGIQFPLLGRIRGTFSLGYKRLIPERLGKKGFSGLIGNTSLYLRLRRFSFRLRYDRDTYFSYWIENIFFLEDGYGAGISYYLTRFLRLDYDLSYRKVNYPEPITLRMPDESYVDMKRKDDYRIHTLGLVLRIIRNTGLGITINFWDRDSNIPWVSRDRMFVGGYLTYEF